MPHNDVLVLASASPRRRQLLLEAGIAHVVRPAALIEERAEGEEPAVYARRLAEEKAWAVRCDPGEVVLGADTIVVVEQEVFGKPRSESQAGEMLRRLSGRDHWVYTGICLRWEGGIVNDEATTRVRFSALSEAEIDEYVRTGEPMDKAGGYAIQGLASRFVTSIEGSYSNVVGLPVALVYGHLRAIWGERWSG